MNTTIKNCICGLAMLLASSPVFAQNVIVDGGDIYYRTGGGRQPYPADYSGLDVRFYFADRNPFPNGKFSNLRIICQDHAGDSVERTPLIIPSPTGAPGFWTALKKGMTYDFYWTGYTGGQNKFGAWTVPANAPRCLGLDVTLDAQANAVKFQTVALASQPSTAPQKAIAPTNAPAVAPAHAAPPGQPSIIGKYFGKDPRNITHYWDFNADGTFLHRWIGGGALGRVSSTERGTFVLSGNELTLTLEKTATSFSQASVTSPRGTISGASVSDDSKVRHATVQFQSAGEPVVVLDETPLKVRHW